MVGLDPMNFPWQLEALTSLLQIADQNKNESIDVTFERF